MMNVIKSEKISDKNKILTLEEDVLGPGRFARPSFRIREGLVHNIKYSKIFLKNKKIIGSVRYFNCNINSNKGLMLGPLIVDQNYKDRGIGRNLVNESIKNIKPASIKFVTLIGDVDYYKQFGFEINYNLFFSINIRKEKILSKILSVEPIDLIGQINLY
jgi:predicted N-acetyltransferase YhbS